MFDERSLSDQRTSRQYCEYHYGGYGVFASLPLLAAVLEKPTAFESSKPHLRPLAKITAVTFHCRSSSTALHMTTRIISLSKKLVFYSNSSNGVSFSPTKNSKRIERPCPAKLDKGRTCSSPMPKFFSRP